MPEAQPGLFSTIALRFRARNNQDGRKQYRREKILISGCNNFRGFSGQLVDRFLKVLELRVSDGFLGFYYFFGTQLAPIFGRRTLKCSAKLTPN